MQIFQRRGLHISEQMIRGYLNRHILTLWGINRDDIKKKLRNDKETP